MRNAYETQSPSPVLQFPSPARSQEQRGLELLVEARLRQLGRVIEELRNTTYLTLLNEKGDAREAMEELLVKQATLRWIVRVARRSEGSARERLWAHIEKALSDLERLADSLRELKPVGASSVSPEAVEDL